MEWGKGFGPISGTVCGFLATVAAMVTANAVGAPGWVLLAGGLAGAAALAGDAHMSGRAPRTIAYRAGCAGAAGIYACVVLEAVDPFHRGFPEGLKALGYSVLVGVILTGVAAALARSCANAERKAADALAAAMTAAVNPVAEARPVNERTRIAREWEDRLARVAGVKLPTVKVPDGLVCRNVTFWDDRAGYDLDFDLPGDGTTFEDIKKNEIAVNAASRLPHGCSAEVLPGAHQGAFILSVSIVNRLGDEEIPYPLDCSPKTINNPVTIGIAMSGAEIGFAKRQTSTAAVGDQGSGKTTTGNVLIARSLECVDTINMAIDMNGGAVALPWMVAARKLGVPLERAPWGGIAAGPEEAVRMTDWLIKVMRDRKASSAVLKYTSNETLMPVSPSLPFFDIYCDEIASYLGSGPKSDAVYQLSQNLDIIQNEGRDAGFRLNLLALSATDEVAPRMMFNGCGNKIALRVANDSEYDYFFGWHCEAKKKDIAGKPGMMFYSIHGTTLRRGKLYNIRPNGMEHVVRATTNYRPAPDARALALSDGYWEGRWTRNAGLLDAIDKEVEALTGYRPAPVLVGALPVAAPVSGGGSPPPPPPPATGGRPMDNGNEFEGAMEGMNEALADLDSASADLARAVAEAEGEDPDKAAEKARFEAMVARDPELAALGGAWPHGTPAPEGAEAEELTDDKRRAFLTVVREHGPIGPGEIQFRLAALGIQRSSTTINKMLKQEMTVGTIIQPGGTGKPYAEGPEMVRVLPR